MPDTDSADIQFVRGMFFTVLDWGRLPVPIEDASPDLTGLFLLWNSEIGFYFYVGVGKKFPVSEEELLSWITDEIIQHDSSQDLDFSSPQAGAIADVLM